MYKRQGLPNGAPLVLNGDDPFLRAAKLPEHVHPVWFSLGDENADVCALNIRQEDDGMTFTLEDREEDTTEVHIPAMGRHNVANALAAYTAATRLGLNAKRVIAGLSQFQQTGMRQKVVHSKGCLLYTSRPNMRVIAGEARGRRLEALPGTDVTRPTLDQVKEAMFSIVQFDLPGARVLDLYAGSGQLGIEALSRGAAQMCIRDRGSPCGCRASRCRGPRSPGRGPGRSNRCRRTRPPAAGFSGCCGLPPWGGWGPGLSLIHI